MHFRVLVRADLLEPIRELLDGRKVEFRSYYRSLGVNAPDLATAASLVQKYLHATDGASLSIGEAEFETLGFEELPDEVLEFAFAPIDADGVYWSSGRVYGEVEDEGVPQHQRDAV